MSPASISAHVRGLLARENRRNPAPYVCTYMFYSAVWSSVAGHLLHLRPPLIALLDSFQQRFCISRHSTTDGPSTSTISTSPNTQHPEDGPSTSRMSTLNLYSLQKIPYSFPPDQLKAMNIKDAYSAGTFLGTSQGWPSLFVVEDDICKLCGSPLGAAKLHPGTRGGSVIYSNLNPFKEVVVKVKECCSSAVSTNLMWTFWM